MVDLVLPLKGEYFDAIRDGSKPEEYRLANVYWTRRLFDRKTGRPRTFGLIVLTKGYPKRDDHSRRLERAWQGFTLKTLTHPHFGPRPVDVYAIDVSVKCGEEEGDLCRRDACCGRLTLQAGAEFESCSCWRSAPCSHCMSMVPECPDCGWRAEEPD